MKKILGVLLSVLLFLCFTSCSKRTDNRTVVWASSPEFAQYIELFNSTHPDNQVILVYKENPADSIPPARDEAVPDIIVGPFLRSDRTWKDFRSLDYLFDRQLLYSDD